MTDIRDSEGTAPAAKKKRVNSKKKGAGFENSVSKILGEALAPLQFRRSQSSGAILGGKNEKLLKQFSVGAAALFVGDVVPTNEDELFAAEGFRFGCVIECKFYRDVETFDRFFEKTKLTDWLYQAGYNALQLKRKPVVICKFNHTDTFCVIPVQYELPRTVSTFLSLHHDWVMLKGFKIFKLDDALKDRDWWLEDCRQPKVDDYVTIKDQG